MRTRSGRSCATRFRFNPSPSWRKVAGRGTASRQRTHRGARSLQPNNRHERLRVLLRHRRLRSPDRFAPDGVAELTEQALLNLAAILEAAGSSMTQLVKTTIFYSNVEDFATINEVYAHRAESRRIRWTFRGNGAVSEDSPGRPGRLKHLAKVRVAGSNPSSAPTQQVKGTFSTPNPGDPKRLWTRASTGPEHGWFLRCPNR